MPLSLERILRWTDFLIANPQLQGTNFLYNFDNDHMCCLGALCKVEGLQLTRDGFLFKKSLHDGKYKVLKADQVLRGDLRTDLGSAIGDFTHMRMPDLVYENIEYMSVTYANDDNVPWAIIAEHFREHYKCAEGVTVNQYLKAKAMGTQQEQQK